MRPRWHGRKRRRRVSGRQSASRPRRWRCATGFMTRDDAPETPLKAPPRPPPSHTVAPSLDVEGGEGLDWRSSSETGHGLFRVVEFMEKTREKRDTWRRRNDDE